MSENTLRCDCRNCVSHRIEVKDYHPEIPWRTSQMQKKQEIRDIMKSHNCDYERACKFYNGESNATSTRKCNA